MEQHKGFIVLVDISGYTNFVSKHNIDSSKNNKLNFGQAHAEHIISDLLERVINELDDVLTINKLQGDAALFYGISNNNENLPHEILKRLQTSFEVFNQRLDELKFVESCKCGTCADVGNLKLKSFVHYGDFLIKEINQFKGIAGQDVILAHRPMKNSISVSKYMLFTKSFTELREINFFIENKVEKYDDVGDVDCTVHYPADKLYNIKLSTKKSWFGTKIAMMKYFINLKSKKDIEQKYSLIDN